jgi:hypothetical protein
LIDHAHGALAERAADFVSSNLLRLFWHKGGLSGATLPILFRRINLNMGSKGVNLGPVAQGLRGRIAVPSNA